MAYKNTLFHVLIGLFLSSCCHRKDCHTIDDINEIQLINFTSTEVDSIVIKTYHKNTNFSSVIDSFFTSAHGRQNGDPDLIIFMPQRLNTTFDYKIEITNINMNYLMTGFTAKKQACNDCFPSGHTYVTVLDNYLVNGEKQTNEFLQITR